LIQVNDDVNYVENDVALICANFGANPINTYKATSRKTKWSRFFGLPCRSGRCIGQVAAPCSVNVWDLWALLVTTAAGVGEAVTSTVLPQPSTEQAISREAVITMAVLLPVLLLVLLIAIIVALWYRCCRGRRQPTSSQSTPNTSWLKYYTGKARFI